MNGYARPGGRKGIRNVVVVAYLVETPTTWRENRARLPAAVHLIGFPGCFPNAYADRIMRQVTTHPNVGAVLLVSPVARVSTAAALRKWSRRRAPPVPRS